jgi:hypothetical protein
MANKILLKGRGERIERPAAGTITPGHLVKENSSGAFVVQTADQVKAPAIVAVENDLEGGTISDNYVSGDYVQAEHLGPGDEFLGIVAAGAGAITRGDELSCAGDGTLEKARAADWAVSGEADTVVPPGVPVAMALESVDNSGGASAVRIKCRVI